LFLKVRPCVAFWTCRRLQNERAIERVGGNVGIITVTEICEVFVGVYFVRKGQITSPPTVII
jgi:hypothetical protein